MNFFLGGELQVSISSPVDRPRGQGHPGDCRNGVVDLRLCLRLLLGTCFKAQKAAGEGLCLLVLWGQG